MAQNNDSAQDGSTFGMGAIAFTISLFFFIRDLLAKIKTMLAGVP